MTFKFQSDSINTAFRTNEEHGNLALNSNLILLIPIKRGRYRQP